MLKLVRGLSVVFASSVGLAMVGCSEDNEAFVRAQASANALTDKSSGTPGERPQSQTQYFKLQQERQANTYSKASGYPGARKK